MTLNSNTAQMRELGELRNHLKWLDEERRKSARKMTELEQRLAQQGREVAERDQKIKELEWHIASFNERLERIPESDPNAAAQEQRLQDLEWHLSNIGTQLSRLPNPDEERARLQEQVAQLAADLQQRTQADKEAAEARFVSEVAALREAESRLALNFQALEESLPSAMRFEERLHPLAEQQQTQAQSLGQLSEALAALREDIALVSSQVRDRTVTLAAESQTNLTSLAARFQEHLEALAEDNRAQFETLTQQLDMRSAMMAAEWQEGLNTVASRVPEISPEFIRLSEQLNEVQDSVHFVPNMVVQIAELEHRIGELDALLSPLAGQQTELATTIASLPELGAQVAQLEQRAAGLEERLEQRAVYLETSLEQQAARVDERLSLHATDLDERLGQYAIEVDERLLPLRENLTDLSPLRDQLPALAGQVARLEESVAKLGNVREMMPLFGRLEQEMELRQAEEVRLSNLISSQEGRFVPLMSGLEEVRESNIALLSRLSDSERLIEDLRRTTQDFNDNWKPAVSEVSRRIGPLTERLTVLNNNVLKAEASLQALGGDQAEMREIVVNLTDDVHRSRTETARQVDAWQVTIDEHKDTIERFTQQWLTLSNQYKEARMAVQNFAHWQKQLEQQKRESSEMLRIETNRMQARWDGFLIEIQEKLKNFELELGQKWQAFELENEQKWAGSRRSEQMWREELGAVDELIQKLQQDNRALIWRVQAAQADAIKKWPRLLMEEVEKAVELNPNRRLSAAASSSRNEMSVVDAIEQGLIKIDYNDESAIDL